MPNGSSHSGDDDPRAIFWVFLPIALCLLILAIVEQAEWWLILILVIVFIAVAVGLWWTWDWAAKRSKSLRK